MGLNKKLEEEKETLLKGHKEELLGQKEEVGLLKNSCKDLTSQLDKAKSQLDKGERVKLNMETLHKEQIQEMEGRHKKEVDKYRLKLEYKKKKEEKAKMDNCPRGDKNLNELVEKHNLEIEKLKKEKQESAKHLKNIETNHAKVIEQYKAEIEKNADFVDQGLKEMEILSKKYNLLQKKLKHFQRILASC